MNINLKNKIPFLRINRISIHQNTGNTALSWSDEAWERGRNGRGDPDIAIQGDAVTVSASIQITKDQRDTLLKREHSEVAGLIRYYFFLIPHGETYGDTRPRRQNLNPYNNDLSKRVDAEEMARKLFEPQNRVSNFQQETFEVLFPGVYAQSADDRARWNAMSPDARVAELAARDAAGLGDSGTVDDPRYFDLPIASVTRSYREWLKALDPTSADTRYKPVRRVSITLTEILAEASKREEAYGLGEVSGTNNIITKEEEFLPFSVQFRGSNWRPFDLRTPRDSHQELTGDAHWRSGATKWVLIGFSHLDMFSFTNKFGSNESMDEAFYSNISTFGGNMTYDVLLEKQEDSEFTSLNSPIRDHEFKKPETIKKFFVKLDNGRLAPFRGVATQNRGTQNWHPIGADLDDPDLNPLVIRDVPNDKIYAPSFDIQLISPGRGRYFSYATEGRYYGVDMEMFDPSSGVQLQTTSGFMRRLSEERFLNAGLSGITESLRSPDGPEGASAIQARATNMPNSGPAVAPLRERNLATRFLRKGKISVFNGAEEWISVREDNNEGAHNVLFTIDWKKAVSDNTELGFIIENLASREERSEAENNLLSSLIGSCWIKKMEIRRVRLSNLPNTQNSVGSPQYQRNSTEDIDKLMFISQDQGSGTLRLEKLFSRSDAHGTGLPELQQVQDVKYHERDMISRDAGGPIPLDNNFLGSLGQLSEMQIDFDAEESGGRYLRTFRISDKDLFQNVDFGNYTYTVRLELYDGLRESFETKIIPDFQNLISRYENFLDFIDRSSVPRRRVSNSDILSIYSDQTADPSLRPYDPLRRRFNDEFLDLYGDNQYDWGPEHSILLADSYKVLLTLLVKTPNSEQRFFGQEVDNIIAHHLNPSIIGSPENLRDTLDHMKELENILVSLLPLSSKPDEEIQSLCSTTTARPDLTNRGLKMKIVDFQFDLPIIISAFEEGEVLTDMGIQDDIHASTARLNVRTDRPQGANRRVESSVTRALRRFRESLTPSMLRDEDVLTRFSDPQGNNLTAFQNAMDSVTRESSFDVNTYLNRTHSSFVSPKSYLAVINKTPRLIVSSVKGNESEYGKHSYLVLEGGLQGKPSTGNPILSTTDLDATNLIPFMRGSSSSFTDSATRVLRQTFDTRKLSMEQFAALNSVVEGNLIKAILGDDKYDFSSINRETKKILKENFKESTILMKELENNATRASLLFEDWSNKDFSSEGDWTNLGREGSLFSTTTSLGPSTKVKTNHDRFFKGIKCPILEKTGAATYIQASSEAVNKSSRSTGRMRMYKIDASSVPGRAVNTVGFRRI